MEQHNQFSQSSRQPLQQYQQLFQRSSTSTTSQNMGPIEDPHWNEISYSVGGVQPFHQDVGMIPGPSRSINRNLGNFPTFSTHNVGTIHGLTNESQVSPIMSASRYVGLVLCPSRGLLLGSQPIDLPSMQSTQNMGIVSQLTGLDVGSSKYDGLVEGTSGSFISHSTGSEMPSQNVGMISHMICPQLPSSQNFGLCSPSLISDNSLLNKNYQNVPQDIQSVITTPESKNILEICTQRLINISLKQQERPQDNDIEFWKSFISEFYAQDGNLRWCMSSNNMIPSDVAEKTWRCDFCHVELGRGFEIDIEHLPSVYKLLYDSGALKEQFHLENPSVFKTTSNMKVLLCENVKHEMVFLNRTEILEGRCCIVFTPDFKICSWKICAQNHEVKVPIRDSILKIGDVSGTQKTYIEDEQNKFKLPADQEHNTSLRTANCDNQSNEGQKSCMHHSEKEKQTSEAVSQMKDLINFNIKVGTNAPGTMHKFISTFEKFDGMPQQRQSLLVAPSKSVPMEMADQQVGAPTLISKGKEVTEGNTPTNQDDEFFRNLLLSMEDDDYSCKIIPTFWNDLDDLL